MKKINFKKELFLLCLLFALGSAWNIQAQGGPGFPGFDDDVNDEAPQAPIDGFIGLALAAGAYFGGRQLKRKQKKHG